jgi:PAS domain S-box-containing protein
MDMDARCHEEWDTCMMGREHEGPPEPPHARPEPHDDDRTFLELVLRAPAGICVIDLRRMRFTSVNDSICFWTGYSREELLDMNPADILGDTSRLFFAQQIQRWLTGDTHDDSVDYQIVARDGRAFNAQLDMMLIPDEQGMPKNAIIISHDITARKQAEEALRQREMKALELARQLEKRNKFVTDFFINISHEFKTPLSILLLGIDLMDRKSERMADGKSLRKHIPVMRQNAYRLSRLVSNLLDITKLDAGFMAPSWERRNVVEWLDRLVKSTEFYANQRGLALEFQSTAPEMSMFIDGFILDRIMLNLLSNAIKHTRPGGRIDVACGVYPGGIRVSVRDTGEGIPMDKQAVIFDRFSQVDTSMTRASEGSGIGLALTKSLVELLGGRISFTSAPGVGSVFVFELPALEREAGCKPAQQDSMILERRVQVELSDIGIDME